MLLQTIVAHNPLCTCEIIFFWLNEYTQKGELLTWRIYTRSSAEEVMLNLSTVATPLYIPTSSIILNLLQNLVLPDFIFVKVVVFYYDCNLYHSYACEHLLTWLLVIYVSLSVKCLFIFFAHFSIMLLVFFSLICRSFYIFWTLILCQSSA